MPRKPSVSPLNGVPTPPGFEAHPERRNHGAWKKEDTPRYKLEQMMKMSEDELRVIIGDASAPMFEHQLAKWIIKGDWKVIESQINQVYGAPKQPVETIDKTPKAIEIKVLQPVESKGKGKGKKNNV